MKKYNILVVEDDAIVADDIVNFLSDLNHHPIGPAFEVESAKLLCTENKIHLALLDIHLETREDGIELALWLRMNHPVPIIFLTAFSDPLTLEKVKKVHPEHYLVKPFNEAQLKAAIEIAMNNFYHPNFEYKIKNKIHLLNQKLPDSFTEREIEVLSLILEGLSNQEIAKRMFVSVNTIKTHLKNIFSKTNATSRMNLFRLLDDI